MISDSYAIINPWAMMVHFDDTSSTKTAMVRTSWLKSFASFTILFVLFDSLKALIKVCY